MQELTQAPQEMHFLESNSNFFPRFSAPVAQASTQPIHAPPQEQPEHLPSFQQHFLESIFIGILQNTCLQNLNRA